MPHEKIEENKGNQILGQTDTVALENRVHQVTFIHFSIPSVTENVHFPNLFSGAKQKSQKKTKNEILASH